MTIVWENVGTYGVLTLLDLLIDILWPPGVNPGSFIKNIAIVWLRAKVDQEASYACVHGETERLYKCFTSIFLTFSLLRLSLILVLSL